ncbi:MAG TPA: hypothetical protein VFR94_25770 [Nitrososphaeraceae archaeon]|nr:hypothetical protein [Nitrososphaeraceae archaeon]
MNELVSSYSDLTVAAAYSTGTTVQALVESPAISKTKFYILEISFRLFRKYPKEMKILIMDGDQDILC